MALGQLGQLNEIIGSQECSALMLSLNIAKSAIFVALHSISSYVISGFQTHIFNSNHFSF